MQNLRCFLPLAAALLACGQAPAPSEDAAADSALDASSPEASAPDAAPPDAAPPDAPFVTAPHRPPPQVPNLGGPVLAHPRLVVVTFADDPLRAQLEDFGRWVGTSAWLRAVASEYGVGPGTLLGTVRRTDNAPDAVTSSALEALLAAGLDDGSIPSPPDGDFANTLYLFFTPRHTTVRQLLSGFTVGTSCMDFSGFHSETTRGGRHLLYAVACNCGTRAPFTELEQLTYTASHEYAETVTDPYPFSNPTYRLGILDESAWVYQGSELTDLCHTVDDYTREGGFVVARSWSNAGAAADRDPCVPALVDTPYFNLSADTNEVHSVAAGDTVTVPLTGYSAGPVSDFLVTQVPFRAPLQLTGTLTETRFRNGTRGSLTVAVPPTARSGEYAVLLLLSTSTGAPPSRHVLPLVFLVR